MEVELREDTQKEKDNRKLDSLMLYDMKLHENREIKTGAITYTVTRVSGGWIYNHIRLDSGQMNMVFVPFNNDMQ